MKGCGYVPATGAGVDLVHESDLDHDLPPLSCPSISTGPCAQMSEWHAFVCEGEAG